MSRASGANRVDTEPFNRGKFTMRTRLQPVILTSALFVLSSLASAFAFGHEPTAHEKAQHGEDFWFGGVGDPGQVTRTIKVTTLDIKYEPAELTVKAGETVKFEVTNLGKLPHEFVLADEKNQVEHEKEMEEMAKSMPGMVMEHNDPNMITVQPGKTKTLVWHFTTPGKLQFGCHVPGHYAAGMVGRLTIT